MTTVLHAPLRVGSEIFPAGSKLSDVQEAINRVMKVNADWSAYDKGVREAGKAVVEIADQYADHVFDDDLSEAFQALRSALSLIPSNGQEDHG